MLPVQYVNHYATWFPSPVKRTLWKSKNCLSVLLSGFVCALVISPPYFSSYSAINQSSMLTTTPRGFLPPVKRTLWKSKNCLSVLLSGFVCALATVSYFSSLLFFLLCHQSVGLIYKNSIIPYSRCSTWLAVWYSYSLTIGYFTFDVKYFSPWLS